MNLSKEYIAIFLLAFGLYANTLGHKYTLDDKIVITENQFTTQGFSGISDLLTTDVFVGFYGKEKNLVTGKRYRPLSLVTFAIEWQLFGKNPFMSHLINLLLYALTGMLLFTLMKMVLPDKLDNPWYLTTPLIIAAIYVAHPLHTEVIANIKGRDEILSLLGSLGALYFTLKWLDTKVIKHMLLSLMCLFLALFSKENAITFLFVIPVTVHYFTNYSFKDNMRSALALVGISAVYIAIRFSLLGIPDTAEATELMNNPFVNSSTSDKFATIFYTFGIYLKLLFFPHPLTHDYYPFHIPIVGWSNIWVLLSLLIYGLMAFWTILGFKTRKPSFYGIAFYLATFSVVSNVVFPIGSFMNERFMYFPTIGFAIILGIAFTFGIYKHIPRNKNNMLLVNSILILMLVGYSYKTVSRNMDWKNDLSLALADVVNSPNSAKANMSAGLSLINRAENEKDAVKRNTIIQAITYLNKSLVLYPSYIQPMLLMGNAYYQIEEYENSLLYFEGCLKLRPNYSFAVNNIEHVGDLGVRNKNSALAVKSYGLLIKHTPNNYRLYLKLGQVYGRDLHNNVTALEYLKKALELSPGNIDVLNKLGIIYSMQGQNQLAIDAFSEVIRKEPTNANTLLNLGITYNNIGNTKLGEAYINKAIKADPSLKR
ncbi:MAG: hypothetical protein COB85_03010 [Bacteroidetes bacterium]|nr:MAG: hypothetical protein COB85_03010 [Bacteroidota bacterium]